MEKGTARRRRAAVLPLIMTIILAAALCMSACGSRTNGFGGNSSGTAAGQSKIPSTADSAGTVSAEGTEATTGEQTGSAVSGPDDAQSPAGAGASDTEPAGTEENGTGSTSEGTEAAATGEQTGSTISGPDDTQSPAEAGATDTEPAGTEENGTGSTAEPAGTEENGTGSAAEPTGAAENGTGSGEDAGGKEAELGDYIELKWDDSWTYAENSKIHSDSVKLYMSTAGERRNRVIAVNAGHGTSGGTKVKTLCHPDGTPKVTGGSTAAGETKATAVSDGTSLKDGISEAKVNLRLALVVRDMLLENGYDVLMIRETDDVQLDNIARTLFANRYADCHIALHYDSSENDKGLFCIGVPNVKSYRSMEPVASHYKEHIALCEALVSGEKEAGVKIYGSGIVDIDLTQTSYSTVPSVDMEVGDKGSDYSPEIHKKIAEGILKGLDIFFAEGD